MCRLPGWGETGACVVVGGAGSCPSGGQGHIQWWVLGVCELSMTLGSLSANGSDYVPVLLVVWHGCPALELADCWVELGLIVEKEI